MSLITVDEIIKVTGGELLCGKGETEILNATTNSRQVEEGDLFVPIIGEKVDGHSFIKNALKDGAAASFTSRKDVIDEEILKLDKAVIFVDDTKRALQKSAAWVRDEYDIPIVGVTGSVGKTTTKEMIAAALEIRMNVLKTEGNMNSQIGLSLMMYRIDTCHDAAVIEMGVSEPDEMKNLADIAKPCFAVITNIGVSHIGQFKTQENIRKEKMNIINQFSNEDDYENADKKLQKKLEQARLSKANVLFVNGDDKLLKQVAEYKKDNTVECDLSDRTKEIINKFDVYTYGASEDCDYVASDITTRDGKTEFRYTSKLNDKYVTLNVLGIHNVYNAVAALAIAECYNISINQAIKGLYDYRPLAMRGTIIEKGSLKVIDDTYNASPDSMKSGINILTSLDNIDKRVAVLADILELGEASKKCHYGVGEYIAKVNNDSDSKNVDELVTVGNEAKEIASAAKTLCNNIIVNSFDNNEDAINYLKNNLSDNTAVLVKGSRGMHTDEIVKALTN